MRKVSRVRIMGIVEDRHFDSIEGMVDNEFVFKCVGVLCVGRCYLQREGVRFVDASLLADIVNSSSLDSPPSTEMVVGMVMFHDDGRPDTKGEKMSGSLSGLLIV